MLSQKDEEPHFSGIGFRVPTHRVDLIFVVTKIVGPRVIQNIASYQSNDLHLKDRLGVVNNRSVLHHI